MEIEFENRRIEAEFERWMRKLGQDDPYKSDETIGIRDVLRAHFLIADYFYSEGYGIGGIGPRDPDLLHSAIYRQFTSFGNQIKWKTPFEKFATLVFGLVKDHPFHDANKRTGLLLILYFLEKRNRVPEVKQRELENFVVDIAEDKLRKFRRAKELTRKTHDPEIKFIADYIKRNSRQRDSRYYTVTYAQLDKRLQEFGFCLHNARNNFIDVCRIEKKRSIFRRHRPAIEYVKLAQIGFPGWKKQVGKGAIATVRRATDLTPQKGVDSAAFFHGADPLIALIDKYHGPLQRLAYR